MPTSRRKASLEPPVVIPAIETTPAWLTYENFYGLREQPFNLSSDPAFFYGSPSHAATLDKLLLGIQRREALSVLTGDIGMGKTTLCRTLVARLDRQTFSSFVTDPFVSREDLLKVVLADFGVVSARELSTGELKRASRTELSFLLYEFLATLSPHACAVVFVDEAQNLSPQLLEEIRVLSGADGRLRQLQVVLVGQLELRDNLRLPEMRQVAQRISVRCTLDPLDLKAVAGYISRRLEVAGGVPERVRFADEAVAAIYEATGGVPRLINRLCDQALHHGALVKTNVIDGSTLDRVARELDVEPGDANNGMASSASVRKRPAYARAAVTPRLRAPSDAFDNSEEWFAEFDARVNDALATVSSLVSPAATSEADEEYPEPAIVEAEPLDGLVNPFEMGDDLWQSQS